MTKQVVSALLHSKRIRSNSRRNSANNVVRSSKPSVGILPNTYLRIYRKMVSNLKIREDILRSVGPIPEQGISEAESVGIGRFSRETTSAAHLFRSENASPKYEVGPTLIWTENAKDLSIFTTAEKYTNFIGFESPFSNPNSPKYLPKILKKMRMTKGSILIKEASSVDPMHIPVHFCAYRVDENGELTIFDPSWHSADPGIYSTTAFYDSLDEFGIVYKHAEASRPHHWQSLLPHDVFCQTWTLQWLYKDNARSFPLPKTRLDAAKHIATYIKEFASIVSNSVDECMSSFSKYKMEGNKPKVVLQSILSNHVLVKTIYDMF